MISFILSAAFATSVPIAPQPIMPRFIIITKTLIEVVNIKNVVMGDIDRYLQEDLREKGDITSDSLFTDENAEARIIAKEKCVVAGLEEAKTVFEKTGAKIELQVNDGDFVKEKTSVAEIKGPVRSILKGERLALNFICRMSGIATETKRLVDKDLSLFKIT